jgi:hypothetical protein
MMAIAEPTATIRTRQCLGQIREHFWGFCCWQPDGLCQSVLLHFIGIGSKIGSKEYCRRFSRLHAKATITKQAASCRGTIGGFFQASEK